MKKNILFPVAVALTLIFAAACKPSVKNELKYYDNNQRTAREFMQRYPAFQKYLIRLSNESARAMAEAKKVKNEEKKAEAMRNANKIISANKLYSKIRSYESKKNECRDKKSELSGIISNRYSYLIREGISNANRALRKAANKMAYADTETETSAFDTVSQAYSIVYDATNDLKRKIKQIKGEKKKKRY